MKKEKILIILINFILILFLYGITYHSFAAWDATTALSGVENYEAKDNGLETSTKNVMATIITVLRIVGTGVAIIMITYIAIKYMTAAAQERAEFKKSATALIVGAIVLFAGTNILAVIANFATTNI